MEFVLSGPSGVILCCPVQGFVLSSPSSGVLCYPVLSTSCQQMNHGSAGCAEVTVSQTLFAGILERIQTLATVPT